MNSFAATIPMLIVVLSAIAIGMRSQAIWLTLPLLLLVLLQRAGRGAAGALLGSVMTFSIGVLLWLVPLLFASGGLRAYRAALTAQGGEDFSGGRVIAAATQQLYRVAVEMIHMETSSRT